jgi:hypothetical protein
MNRRLSSLSLAAFALMVVAGCGGSSNGGPQDALSLGTAGWVVLDLDTREIRYLADVPEANVDPLYRTQKMIFRRVRTGGGDIFVAQYEVTQRQWDLLGAGPLQPWLDVDPAVCRALPADEGRPAYNLSHLAVMDALTAFTLPGGARLDLPTASEWTAACGVTSGWWWGQTSSDSQIKANAVVRESVISDARPPDEHGVDNGGPLAVGSKAANRWGLYDVLGNVWEWTREGTEVRGGSWYDGIQTCRAEMKAGAANGIADWIDYALVGARPVLRP